MNNIRKIIEEHLENARNDYRKTTREFNAELKGQFEAYLDCLNLFPAPRTEQELIKEFEKLGYKIEMNNDLFLEIGRYNDEFDMHEYICINKDEHTYEKYLRGGETMALTIQEHKLLNELFEVWQWI
jgi:hypothetical protein